MDGNLLYYFSFNTYIFCLQSRRAGHHVKLPDEYSDSLRRTLDKGMWLLTIILWLLTIISCHMHTICSLVVLLVILWVFSFFGLRIDVKITIMVLVVWLVWNDSCHILEYEFVIIPFVKWLFLFYFVGEDEIRHIALMLSIHESIIMPASRIYIVSIWLYFYFFFPSNLILFPNIYINSQNTISFICRLQFIVISLEVVEHNKLQLLVFILLVGEYALPLHSFCSRFFESQFRLSFSSCLH